METYLEIEKLVTVKESFAVILDSRNATRYNNGEKHSDVYFEFENPISFGKEAIQVSCSVASFSSPNSLYIINETNNKLVITLVTEFDNFEYIILIPYGDYNINSFLTQLRSQIDTSFTITFSLVSSRIKFTNSGFEFFINSSSTIGDVMGFSSKETNQSTLKILSLPYMVNFNGLNNFNISCQNLNTQNIDSFSKSNSSIIQSVSLNSNLNHIYFSKSSDFQFIIKDDIIGFLHIQLMDDLENLINLNSKHWNMTLNFSVIKDVNRFSHLQGFNAILKNGYVEGLF